MANERFEIEARGFQHERLVIERFQSEIVLSYGIEKPNIVYPPFGSSRSPFKIFFT